MHPNHWHTLEKPKLTCRHESSIKAEVEFKGLTSMITDVDLPHGVKPQRISKKRRLKYFTPKELRAANAKNLKDNKQSLAACYHIWRSENKSLRISWLRILAICEGLCC